MADKAVRELTIHQRNLLWHRAMELYMDGLTAEEVAAHRDVPFSIHSVRKKAHADGWYDKRKTLEKTTKGNTREETLEVDKAMEAVRDQDTIDLLAKRNDLWKQWSPHTKDTVLDMVRTGKSLKAALELFGFHKDYATRLAKSDPDFMTEYRAAVREYEMFLIDKMHNHANKSFQATAYLLEHNHALKEEYAEKKEGGGGINIVMTFERKPIDTFEVREPKMVDVEVVNAKDVKELPMSPSVEIVKPKLPTREDVLNKAREKVKEYNEKLRAKNEQSIKEPGAEGNKD